MQNFIVFILILFALAALLRVDFFFTIFYLFIGVYIVLRFWSRRMLKKIELTRNVQPRAFLGEQVTVTLTIKNRSRLPVPWLLINETFSTVLSSPPFFREVIFLGGKETQTLKYVLVARRRGYYEIGPARLETGDLLGVNRGLRGHVEADHLIVYPKIVPIARVTLPTHSPQVILPTPTPLFKDSTRIIGVKPYTQGDNPRHIHWPATASQGQVLVKKFETAIARDNAIFLNMDLPDYGRTGQARMAIELAIVAAASMANHMTRVEELPVGLVTRGEDPLTDSQHKFRLLPDKGRSHLMQILEVLARVEGIEAHHFLDDVRQEALHLSWGTSVIIITCNESQALLQTLLLLKRSGFKVTLFLVQPAAYVYPKPANLQRLGIPTFKISREKEIEAWFPVQ